MENVSRVAAVYDVHGNLPALEAVLADLGEFDYDLLVVGGDVASGPMPSGVLDRLAMIGDRVRWVCGNADREVVDAYDRGSQAADVRPSDPALLAAAWTASRIGGRQRDLMASFQPRVEVEVGELGGVLFCHGGPESDEEILTTATSDERLLRILAGVGLDLIVCGHVHTQYDRTVDGKRVINAGSVGIPYQGRPVGAFWALLGPEGVALHRSDYDLGGAVERFRTLEYPGVEDLVEALLEPPNPDWVADFFERQAGDRF
jgi:predicted phosphodiesterase